MSSDTRVCNATYDLNHNVQEAKVPLSSSNGSITESPEAAEKFYSHSKDYWAKQPPTVNGMLGGYDYVSTPDIEQSQHFLNYFLKVS